MKAHPMLRGSRAALFAVGVVLLFGAGVSRADDPGSDVHGVAVAPVGSLMSGTGVSAFTPLGQADGQSPVAAAQLQRFANQQRLEQVERERERQGPEATAERERSRSAHDDLSDGAAVELLSSEFGDEIRPLVPDAQTLFGGAEVKEFRGDYVAVVGATQDSPARLIDSQVPLRTPDLDVAGAPKRPTDLDLVRDGGFYRAANGPVITSLGEASEEGIRLGQMRIDLGGSAPAQRVDSDTLAYPNLATDSDLAVNLTPGGLETFDQIRSPDAPETRSMHLSLPTGAKLQRTAGGGARVIDSEGTDILEVSAPTAVDAQGSSVPTSLDVDGDTLKITTDHRDRSVAYPVLVDPEFTVKDDWGCSTGAQCNATWLHNNPTALAGLPFWEGQLGPNPGMHVSFNCVRNTGIGMNNCYGPGNGCTGCSNWASADPGWSGGSPYAVGGRNGLHVWADPNTTYSSGQFAQWAYHPPGTSTQIYRADMGAKFYLGATGQIAMYDGVATPNGWATPNGLHLFTTAVTQRWDADFASSSTTPPGPQGLVLGLINTGGDIRPSQFINAYMGASVIQLTDPEPPSIVRKDLSGPTGWTNNGSWTVNAAATDAGLGVRRLRLYVPSTANGGQVNNDRNAYCSGFNGYCAASCSGAKSNPCPSNIGAGSDYGTAPFRFSTADANGEPVDGNQPMPEGIQTITVTAADALGTGTDENGRAHETPAATVGATRVDRSGPDLSLTGDLSTLNIDASGRDLYGLHIVASDGVPGGSAAQQRSGVESVRVEVDGTEDDSFSRDENCAGDSCPLTADYELDTDVFKAEGSHTVRVVAVDKAGNSAYRTLTIRVPRENYYASELAQWKSDVERRVDNATPAISSTAPMPSVPERWRNADACEASTGALNECYSAGMTWVMDVKDWLHRNLANVTMPDLPPMPTFEYSPEVGTARDLTRRMSEGFEVVKRFEGEPTVSLPITFGFHEPVSVARLKQLAPRIDSARGISLTGIFDPGGTDINGGITVPAGMSLTAAVESFYTSQTSEIAGDIAELSQETPVDAEEDEDNQAALGELQAARDHLQARNPYVMGISYKASPTAVLAVLRDPNLGTDIKSLALTPIADTATTPDLGREVLDSLATDSGTVAAASRAAPASSGSTARAATSTREQTCGQRGQGQSRGAKKTRDPNPRYYAPSRLKYDTTLGAADSGGSRHQKLHRLHFRYADGDGLAWMCGDSKGDRSVEMEARVFPDDARRWSENWEDKDVGDTVTLTNLPQPIHQDDLAVGNGSRVTDKLKYPDFAIVTQSAWALRYRKLYRVHFRTDDGPSDAGKVIYSAQADRRASGNAEQGYCTLRNRHYQSCMFGTTTTCYDQKDIASAADYRRVDWGARLGSAWSLGQIDKDHPKEIKGTGGEGDVTSFCDPRPPGSDAH